MTTTIEVALSLLEGAAFAVLHPLAFLQRHWLMVTIMLACGVYAIVSERISRRRAARRRDRRAPGDGSGSAAL